MIVEERIYTFHPPKLRAWLEIYEKYGMPVQKKHLGRNIGFFVTEIGTLNQVIHLWEYDSLADREQRRGAMWKDPAWQDYVRRTSELAGIQSQEVKIMIPTSFSPVR